MRFKKIGLKTALFFLRGLIYLKRSLTFLFSILLDWLSRLGPSFSRYFLFPLYKIYLSVRKRLAFLIDPVARTLVAFSVGRTALVLLSLVLIFIFVGSETRAYASNKYLGGQQSLIFNYVGVSDDIDFTDESVTESAPTVTSAPWSRGALAPIGSFNQAEIPLDEITGTTLDGLALVQPLFLPGAVFGTGRTKVVTHVVEAGDNFGSLANKFGVSIETILWANNLKIRSLLHPGDVLKILPVSGVAHKVKKGDTLKKIAALYNTTEDKISDFNHLAGLALVDGEELIVPDGRITNAPPVPRSYYNVPPPQRPFVALPPSLERVSGGFIWPTTVRRITQYFRGRFHPGIDIGMPTGNAIYAASDGVVEMSGWNRGGYGYMILLDHSDNIKTRYGHASRLLVSPGEQVSKGQVIALIGSTGRSTGPHVHFEVIVNGVRVNPLLYVR